MKRIVSHPLCLLFVVGMLVCLLAFHLFWTSSSSFFLPEATPTPIPPPTATPTVVKSTLRPAFLRGITVPYQSSYNALLRTIRRTTKATALYLPLVFEVPTSSSMHVSSSNISLAEARDAILTAHEYDMSVLLGVSIHVERGQSVLLSSDTDQSAWFASLFYQYLPYLRLAASLHVEAVTLVPYLSWMEQHANTRLWQRYIDSVMAQFRGAFFYTRPFTALSAPFPVFLQKAKFVALTGTLTPSVSQKETGSDIAYMLHKTLFQTLDQFSTHTHTMLVLVPGTLSKTVASALLPQSFSDQHIAGVYAPVQTDATLLSVWYTQ